MIDASTLDLKEKVVALNRVAKLLKVVELLDLVL